LPDKMDLFASDLWSFSWPWPSVAFPFHGTSVSTPLELYWQYTVSFTSIPLEGNLLFYVGLAVLPQLDRFYPFTFQTLQCLTLSLK